MPFKFEKENLKIPLEYDRRIKLTIEDKVKIKELYEEKGYSKRKLAKMFGVSRRLIQFVLDKESYERNKILRKLRSKNYYDKKKHLKYTKKHREYKKKLYNKKLLKKEKS